jgi:hypothetical protein
MHIHDDNDQNNNNNSNNNNNKKFEARIAESGNRSSIPGRGKIFS